MKFRILLTHTSAAVALTVLGIGCAGAKHYSAQGNDPARGADAQMSVEPSESGNQTLTVKVEHLLPPDRVGGGLSNYVVWIVPGDRGPELAGILDYDSSRRMGTFQTTTPYEHFEVIITAEMQARPEKPGSAVIVRQDVSAR